MFSSLANPIKKSFIVLLSALLFACQSPKEEVVEKVEEVETLQEKQEHLAKAIQEGSSSSPYEELDWQALQEEISSYGKEYVDYQIYPEENACVIEFENQLRIYFYFEENQNISHYVVETIPKEPELTQSTSFQEQLILLGNGPYIYGILTTPKGVRNAPVVILLPEEMDDDINESGKEEDYRKELAHGLARNQVASLRYEMRLHNQPSLGKDASLEKLISEDFAMAVHGMENLPVDPLDISVLGIGESAVLATGLTYQHFEVTGGLILWELPKETALTYRAKQEGLTEEVETIKEAIEEESQEELFGHSMSYWKSWKNYDIEKLLPSIKAPVLFIHGNMNEDDDAYRYWKKEYEKRSRTIFLQYDTLDHHLKSSSRTLNTIAVSDIAYWIRIGTLPNRTVRP